MRLPSNVDVGTSIGSQRRRKWEVSEDGQAFDLNTAAQGHSFYIVDMAAYDVSAGKPAQWIWICIVDTNHFLRWNEHGPVLTAEALIWKF